MALLENSQNPHHFDLAQSAITRKGLPGADRARKVQGSTRQGPCEATD